MAIDSKEIYQLILNPRQKYTKKSADAKRFARIVMEELEGIMSQLADPDTEYVIIDGQKVKKSDPIGQLVINDKLSELENLNTQNFN
ncbi:MAG: hypothetical protein KKA19_02625, partial [Candidatus Margulisbacteria bacterium]|nr:hypothetical protein [Candidatus Margulisiibacteriota bacterium]